MFLAWFCHANVSYIQKKQENSGPVQLSKVFILIVYILFCSTCIFESCHTFIGTAFLVFLMYTMFIQFLGKDKDDSARRSAVSGKKVFLIPFSAYAIHVLASIYVSSLFNKIHNS